MSLIDHKELSLLAAAVQGGQHSVKFVKITIFRHFTIARRMANPRVAANVPQNTAATVEPKEKIWMKIKQQQLTNTDPQVW